MKTSKAIKTTTSSRPSQGRVNEKFQVWSRQKYLFSRPRIERRFLLASINGWILHFKSMHTRFSKRGEYPNEAIQDMAAGAISALRWLKKTIRKIESIQPATDSNKKPTSNQ